MVNTSTCVLDKLGKQITPGCYIAYPVMYKRKTDLRIGRVSWVNKRFAGAKIYIPGTRHYGISRITIRRPDRVIVLDSVSDEYKKLLG